MALTKNSLSRIFTKILIYCIMKIRCQQAPCRTPTNLSSRFLQINYHEQTSPYTFPLENVVDFNSNVLNNIPRDTSCPASLPTLGDFPLKDRSLCPWYYTLNHRPDRFPAIILEAVPKCQDCVGETGNGNHVCERLYRSLKVLIRLECQHGEYQYVERIEEFAIASICAQRREMPSVSKRFEPGPNDILSM